MKKKSIRIAIIDADLLDNGTRHPNLALMKISAFHKNQKNTEVILLENYKDINMYDTVYIGKVFDFTNIPINIYDYDNIVVGGTGFGILDQPLDYEVEHMMPDYTLYNNYVNRKIEEGEKENRFSDYQHYSIGFTTRGCFRKCEFCINKKYDRVEIHSPINEFLDHNRKHIYLWDDNFLGYSGWETVLENLNKTGKKFQFRQGLDIRLMTKKKAVALANSNYHGDFIFAFDHIDEKEMISKKLKLWKENCKKTTKLYVLCAYDSQDILDITNTFERIRILMKYGSLPYIMRYDSYKNSNHKDMYIQLARWCNQPAIFKKMSFRQFAEANQKYHKNKDTICSTLKVLKRYEKEFPKLAKKYFDIRYEDMRKY